MCTLYHTPAYAARAECSADARALAEAAIRAALVQARRDAERAGAPIVEVRLDADTWQILTVIKRPSRIPNTGRPTRRTRLSESDRVGRSDDTKTP